MPISFYESCLDSLAWEPRRSASALAEDCGGKQLARDDMPDGVAKVGPLCLHACVHPCPASKRRKLSLDFNRVLTGAVLGYPDIYRTVTVPSQTSNYRL